jgi:hypothetical membrane protein
MFLNVSIDDFKSLGRLACVSTAFPALQLLLLTSLAAILYTGGYDYFGYYFSDLGRVSARNGEPNPVSSLLFLVTVSVFAVFTIPFWITLYSFFRKTTVEKILGLLGSLSGLLTAPLLIGVGIFPMDTRMAEHSFFAAYFFLAIGFALLMYSIAMLFNREYSNFYSIIGFVLFPLIIIYVAPLFGIVIVPLDGFRALVQKIIVYGFIIWDFTLIFRIWPSVEPGKKIFA